MLSRFLSTAVRQPPSPHPAALLSAMPQPAPQGDGLSLHPSQILEALLYRSEGFLEDLGPGYDGPQAFNPATPRP